MLACEGSGPFKENAMKIGKAEIPAVALFILAGVIYYVIDHLPEIIGAFSALTAK
jgi:hypothetical protein